MGIAIRIGGLAVGSSGSRWTPQSQLDGESVNFWAKGRSGLIMPDSVAGNDVSILTPTYMCVANNLNGDKTRTAEHIFDGNSYTIYFKMRQISDISTLQWPLRFGNDTGTARGFTLAVVSGTLGAYIGDGTRSASNNQITNVNTNLKGTGWVEVFIQINGTTNGFICKMYKQSDGSSLGTDWSRNNAGWTFNNNDNGVELQFISPNFAFADLKKFSGLKTITQCRDNSYVIDVQMYYPEMISGTDVSGNGNHLTQSNISVNYKSRYYSNVSTYLLDYGYSIYRKNYEPDVLVPNNTLGIAIARTFSGYTLRKIVAGSLTKHNLADSLLEFTGASSGNWDKSDATLFGTIPQLIQLLNSDTFTYYNATYPKRWHIYELNKVTMNLFYNINYKGLTFPKITNNSINDSDLLTELFGFDTDKTGSELTKVLNYTKDNRIITNAIIGTCIVSTTPRIKEMFLKGIIGTEQCAINWGDGSVTYMLMDGSLEDIFHVYNENGTYQIQIQGVSSLSEINFNSLYLEGDATQIQNVTNLLKIDMHGSLKTGSISGWNAGLQELLLTENDKLAGGSTLTGTIDRMTDLRKIYLWECNTISGDISNKIHLEHSYISGYSTITGDISNLINLVQWETSMPGTGWSIHCTGDITNLINLETICSDTIFRGDATNCIKFKYFESGQITSTMIADITGWVDCYVLAVAQNIVMTGSIAGMTKLQYIGPELVYVDKPLRFLNRIVSFPLNPSWVWSSVEINQLLADLWANKDISRVDEDGFEYQKTRYIGLSTAGSGAPTGQGLTDLAALRAYRSPNNDPQYALWTIDVNP